MSVTGTIVDGFLEITFKYRVPVDKRYIPENAAQYYFEICGYGDHGTDKNPRVFGDLSDNEKLELLDRHTKRVHFEAAKTNYKKHGTDKARAEADIFIKDNFEME